MSQNKWQKMKMLKVVELLNARSSVDNPLTTECLCTMLSECDIRCDRRTLSKDIRQLKEFGYDIQSVYKGHEKAYYIDNVHLSRAEAKILSDAVQAASFLPKKESDLLAEKLDHICGLSSGQTERSVIHFNRNKHTNEKIYAIVEGLSIAIKQHSQASFLYFDRDENSKIVYRKDGKRYYVDPISLVYNSDRYYLMCMSEKYESVTIYRVDRMDDVHVEHVPVNTKAILTEEEIADYLEQSFNMYGGPVEDLALQFDQSLIGVIQDKFGEETKMIRLNHETCIATLKIQVSPTFWGWLFQFAGKMKIISPEKLVDEYRRLAESVLK